MFESTATDESPFAGTLETKIKSSPAENSAKAPMVLGKRHFFLSPANTGNEYDAQNEDYVSFFHHLSLIH